MFKLWVSKVNGMAMMCSSTDTAPWLNSVEEGQHFQAQHFPWWNLHSNTVRTDRQDSNTPFFFTNTWNLSKLKLNKPFYTSSEQFSMCCRYYSWLPLCISHAIQHSYIKKHENCNMGEKAKKKKKPKLSASAKNSFQLISIKYIIYFQ